MDVASKRNGETVRAVEEILSHMCFVDNDVMVYKDKNELNKFSRTDQL